MEQTNHSNKPPHQGAAARLTFHVILFIAMCVSNEILAIRVSDEINLCF